jgi:hypothetical protein
MVLVQSRYTYTWRSVRLLLMLLCVFSISPIAWLREITKLTHNSCEMRKNVRLYCLQEDEWGKFQK